MSQAGRQQTKIRETNRKRLSYLQSVAAGHIIGPLLDPHEPSLHFFSGSWSSPSLFTTTQKAIKQKIMNSFLHKIHKHTGSKQNTAAYVLWMHDEGFIISYLVGTRLRTRVSHRHMMQNLFLWDAHAKRAYMQTKRCRVFNTSDWSRKQSFKHKSHMSEFNWNCILLSLLAFHPLHTATIKWLRLKHHLYGDQLLVDNLLRESK